MDNSLKVILSLIESKYKNDAEFENDFKLARSTVSAWRNGKLKSYNKRIGDIAEFFDVSPEYILGTTQKNSSLSEKDKLLETIKVKLQDKDVKDIKKIVGIIDQIVN